MDRFHIGLGDVIGHNESRTSGFTRSSMRAGACQTHGDWTKADMDRYRARLVVLAAGEGVPLGGRVRTVTPDC
jgi:hypothetical protein